MQTDLPRVKNNVTILIKVTVHVVVNAVCFRIRSVIDVVLFNSITNWKQWILDDFTKSAIPWIASIAYFVITRLTSRAVPLEFTFFY